MAQAGPRQKEQSQSQGGKKVRVLGDDKLRTEKDPNADLPKTWSQLMRPRVTGVCWKCDMMFSTKAIMWKHFAAANNCAPPLGATDDLRMKKRKALDKKKCEDAKSKSQSKRMLEKEMLRETEHEPQPDLEEPNDNDTVEHNEVPEELIVQVKFNIIPFLYFNLNVFTKVLFHFIYKLCIIYLFYLLLNRWNKGFF